MEKDKIRYYVGCFFFALVTSIYFFGELNGYPVPIHSDDAGTMTTIRNMVEYGMECPLGILSGKYSIFFTLNRILYLFFGATTYATQLAFAIRFFLCMLPTILLINDEGEKKIDWVSLLFLCYMVVFPQFDELYKGITSFKYHMDPTILFLFMVLFYKKYSHSKKKQYFLGIILCLFASFFTGDVLVVPFIYIPFFLFAQIKFIVWGKKYIYAKIEGVVLAIAVVIYRIVDSVMGQSGFSGYGSRCIVEISKIGGNIALWFKGLVSLFNADIEGNNMLSFNTISSGVKLLIVIVMLGCVVVSIWNSVCQKSKNEVALLLSLSVVSSSICFILTTTEFTTEEVARYFNVIIFALPLVMISFIKDTINKDNNRRIVVIILLLLITSVFHNVSLIIVDETQSEVNRILTNEQLENGIGNFWSANILSMYSDYEIEVQPVYLDGTQVKPMHNEYVNYADKSNLCNFVILDDEMTLGIDKEAIVGLYGVPQKDISIEDREVLVYSFDLRPMPLRLLPVDFQGKNGDVIINDNAIQICEGVEIESPQINIESGTLEINVVGKNLDNCMIEIDDANKTIEYNEIYRSSDGIVMELNSYGLTSINIDIKNISGESYIDEVTMVYKQIGVVIGDEINSSNGEVSVGLEDGVYKLVFYGDNINDINIDVDLDNYKKTEIGKKRVSYVIEVKNGNVQLDYSTKGKVNRISIENYDSKDNQTKLCVNGLVCKCNGTNLEYSSGVEETEKNALCVPNGETVYGPYISIDKGTYLIQGYGNIRDCDLSITYNAGQDILEYELIELTDTCFKIKVELEESVNLFEVVIRSKNDKTILNGYSILETNY